MQVRRDRVLSALEWLQANNPFYSNVTINYVNLQRLPENDIPSQLLSIEEKEDALSHQSICSDSSDDENDSRSFLPILVLKMISYRQPLMELIHSIGLT